MNTVDSCFILDKELVAQIIWAHVDYGTTLFDIVTANHMIFISLNAHAYKQSKRCKLYHTLVTYLVQDHKMLHASITRVGIDNNLQ